MVTIPDFGKKKDRHVPDNKFDPNKVYENMNKLPLIVGDYRSSMMKKLRAVFLEQLALAVKEEKEYCKKSHQEPQMQGDFLRYVTELVDRCKTIFEIEALARYLFDDNEVPSYENIQFRAKLLDNAFPVRLKH